jgi:hypothetical protein
MKKRTSIFLRSLCALLAFVAAGRAAEQPKLDVETLQRQSIENAISGIHRLKFLKPVTYATLSHDEIKRTVQGKLKEQFTDDEFKNVSLALAAMGLIRRDYPLREKFVDILGEQIAAFYDHHQHQLFMFADATLDKAENRVILSHELTHALQDQHFDLLKLPLEIKNNDDRAIAAGALVEGDATVVMMQYLLQNVSWRGMNETLTGLASRDMNQIEKAPRYLRETLVFPYAQGQQFCLALQAQGGYAAISAAFKNPPSSSAQILHPEKYLAEPREEPVAIEWSDTTANGKEPIADNVLGELGVRILLSDWVDEATGQKAAAGWRGDRYLVFDDGNAVVWKTMWRSEESAGEFFRAAQKYLANRYKPTDGKLDDSAPNAASFTAAKPRALRLAQSEASVFLFDANTVEWVKVLQQKFSQH